MMLRRSIFGARGRRTRCFGGVSQEQPKRHRKGTGTLYCRVIGFSEEALPTLAAGRHKTFHCVVRRSLRACRRPVGKRGELPLYFYEAGRVAQTAAVYACYVCICGKAISLVKAFGYDGRARADDQGLREFIGRRGGGSTRLVATQKRNGTE